MQFVCLLLAWGWMNRSSPIIRLALWWTVALAGISIAIKFTGDFAADQSAPRLDLVRSWVSAHEQMADRATTAMFFLGLSAALALFVGRRKAQGSPAWCIAVVIALGVTTTILLAFTANAGGRISHPEIRASPLN